MKRKGVGRERRGREEGEGGEEEGGGKARRYIHRGETTESERKRGYQWIEWRGREKKGKSVPPLSTSLLSFSHLNKHHVLFLILLTN